MNKSKHNYKFIIVIKEYRLIILITMKVASALSSLYQIVLFIDSERGENLSIIFFFRILCVYSFKKNVLPHLLIALCSYLKKKENHSKNILIIILKLNK